MRKIKFRAWDIINKKWHIWHQFTHTYDGEPYTIMQMGNGDTDLIYCQFTGLLDKNGKEIYEGDILLNHFRNQKLTVLWNPKIGDKGGGWDYEKIENDTNLTWQIEPENIEIIGNIYENPELLK